ncbi:hypothetical protein NIES4072_31570 [Nostoc commune NIES-4072]|uniref:Uncharacterized protein n=1 Tax=Nostoc commune NIES-4072 TaxID=2005467 RepID=A0A2R5FN72_NOSCO|nr:hypothetical protein [Nostoc commune]BBD69510.1 hypothetical protein NIES4070_59190 [Nostoc commune HK-02]GBG19489.1 hypothetical protein NIES4072_31570 [Nostoc commune NIES-4072]
MHPKVVEDFAITDQEISDCKEVVGWFNAMFHEFVTQLTKNAEAFDLNEES